MTSRRRPVSAGYTLIELSVTAIAILLLVGVVYNLFTTHVYEGIETEVAQDLSSDARLAMHVIAIDVKRAQRVKIDGSKLTLHCFKGKPMIGFPNAGLEAAQVDQIEYYLDKDELVQHNVTTHARKVVAKNVNSFKAVAGKEGGVVGIALEAECEVVIERQKFSKVKIALYEKIHPLHLSERAKYKGYFCSVDEDGTY